MARSNGRAALASGRIDALVTWEPFVSSIQRQTKARVLADAQSLAAYKRYYVTTGDYATTHAPELAVIFEKLVERGRDVKAHPQAATRILAKLWGIDEETVLDANAKRSYEVGAVKRDAFGEQQAIADAFFAAGLLPRPGDANAVAIFKPGQ